METQIETTNRIEINEERKDILLVAYGTLRLFRSNYSNFLENKSEFLGTFKSEPRYTMYGKQRHFPIVVDDGNTSIEYDVFRIQQDTILEKIHKLEGCTGYPGHPDNWYDIVEIETPVGTAYMYVMHGHPQGEEIIKSGNWNNKHL